MAGTVIQNHEKKGPPPTVMNPTKFILFPYTGILAFDPVILIHPIQKAFSAFPDPIYTRERIDSMPVSALALQKPSLVIHPCWQMWLSMRKIHITENTAPQAPQAPHSSSLV